MLGVTRDIHEAHEAALALKRDAAILAQLMDAVVVTDQAYCILSVNEAYERIFGWAKADAVGQHALFRLKGPARAEGQCILDRVLRGESVDLEWEDYRSDGSRVWIHWRAQPLFDEHGHLSGTVNVGRDISEQKAAAERHRQLQQQLFHAQKMDTLGTLAGGIAHDLNNILAVIFGFNELAAKHANESAETRHYHEQIIKAGVRGRELVKRILAFSRFEEPQRLPVHLAEVIADAVKFMRATLPATVEVISEVPSGLSPVLADPHQLCQVLLNLATNAAHAMDHRGQFSLRLRPADFPRARPMATGVLAAGCYYVIEAEDTGHGIAPELVSRVFDPFFSTKKEGEGTGLGLSVVRAIVDGHGGRVDVHSEPGRGARFAVYLPRSPVGTATPLAAPASTPLPKGSGQTVAVIDDDTQIAAVTVAGLQRIGYQSMSFESAQRFWGVFSVAPSGIDAIVTDQTMPGMTGLELVRRLREEGHDLPVLLVTGFSVQVRPETAKEYPRLSLLRKPYGLNELAGALHDLLSLQVAEEGRSKP